MFASRLTKTVPSDKRTLRRHSRIYSPRFSCFPREFLREFPLPIFPAFLPGSYQRDCSGGHQRIFIGERAHLPVLGWCTGGMLHMRSIGFFSLHALNRLETRWLIWGLSQYIPFPKRGQPSFFQHNRRCREKKGKKRQESTLSSSTRRCPRRQE